MIVVFQSKMFLDLYSDIKPSDAKYKNLKTLKDNSSLLQFTMITLSISCISYNNIVPQVFTKEKQNIIFQTLRCV